MTYKEILDICVPQTKRKIERSNPWEYYIGRMFSIPVTHLMIRTSISPSAVTFISIMFSLAGFFLVGFGNSVPIRITGWLCFLIWGILDCVDGNLARCKNLCSTKGELWDALGGYISLTLIFFSAGIAAFFDDNAIYLLEPHYYLILAGATSLLAILPRLMAQKKKAICGEESVNNLMDKMHFSLPKLLARNLESSAGIMQLILLLSIIFHILNLYIVFYFIFNALIALYSFRVILK